MNARPQDRLSRSSGSGDSRPPPFVDPALSQRQQEAAEPGVGLLDHPDPLVRLAARVRAVDEIGREVPAMRDAADVMLASYALTMAELVVQGLDPVRATARRLGEETR